MLALWIQGLDVIVASVALDEQASVLVESAKASSHTAQSEGKRTAGVIGGDSAPKKQKTGGSWRVGKGRRLGDSIVETILGSFGSATKVSSPLQRDLEASDISYTEE